MFKKVVKRLAELANICYNCGYNRSGPGTCPNCGEPVS